jgi:hypothetical protein
MDQAINPHASLVRIYDPKGDRLGPSRTRSGRHLHGGWQSPDELALDQSLRGLNRFADLVRGILIVCPGVWWTRDETE